MTNPTNPRLQWFLDRIWNRKIKIKITEFDLAVFITLIVISFCGYFAHLSGEGQRNLEQLQIENIKLENELLKQLNSRYEKRKTIQD